MTINVALGGSIPRLVRDIIKTLAGKEADINISNETLSQVELRSRINEQATDVIIVGSDPKSGNSIGVDLLNQCKRIRVITVANGNCGIVLHSLKPISRDLGQLSPETLLDAIRESRDDLPTDGRNQFTIDGEETAED